MSGSTSGDGCNARVDPDRPAAPLLVTTAIEETWGDHEPIVFLGEWCRLYDRREVWKSRQHYVVGNHWDDRNKLKSDYNDLKGLHDRLLAGLVPAMNGYHRIERPLRYWQMILDPWLLTYVAVIWDRWECLRLAFAEHEQLQTIALNPDVTPEACADYDDFIQKILDDPWNHRLCLDIIRSNFSDRCRVSESAAKAVSSAKTAARASAGSIRRSVRQQAADFLDRCLGVVSSRDRVVFFQSYFPTAALVNLNLNLKQLPRSYRNEFGKPLTAGDPAAFDFRGWHRDGLSIKCAPANAFESFLTSRIVNDIPIAYMEGFSSLRARALRIPMKPRAILTANAHWHDSLFKLWSAEQVLNGVKFVCMEHGGGLYPSLYAMSFEEDIADVKTTWAVPFHKKQMRLPPNKLVTVRFQSSGKHLAVVGCEMPRYAYRADAAPKASQNLTGIIMVTDLCASLAEDILARMRIKPAQNQGWNTRQRFIDALGRDKISNEKDYYRFLSGARLIVCTYPQTNFSEAMTSGIPTVLLYSADLWETIPQLDPLLAMLRAAKIVFHDAQSAAAHINQIWADPLQWWSSPKVFRARNEFHLQALDLSGDWLGKWTAFIEEVVA